MAIRNVTLLLILCATIISWIENYAQEGASEKRPDELDRLTDAWVDQLDKRDSRNMVMSVLREPSLSSNYKSARNKTLDKHPMSWLYEMWCLNLV